MRLRTAFAALSIVVLTAACTQEAETPPQPVEPSPAPAAPAAPPISYACESGQAVTVAYPDTSTAQLTYKGQSYTLRTVQSASGARYTGSDLEWWTVTRDGQESATLSRLGPNDTVGAAVLERCSRPAVSAVPTGPVPPAAAGGAVPASAPCRGSQLKLTPAGGDAGAGNRVSVLGVQNVGAQACSLTGYPTVALQDPQGRALSTIRTEQNPGSYFRAGQAPAPVELAPQGQAFFDLAWSAIPNEGRGERTCPTAARIRMTAPGDTSPVTLSQSFSPCGGRIQVGPFRPVAEPAPVPAA